ncbi:MAG: GntR family transcriptional regulator [candidate division KSB1 bacterium]|nr:GntR family transcriptional regulator [candidate division KSB1 bacterium]
MTHTELTDHVYSRLKRKILDRELLPGQKILQEKLAAELGVSRSPLLKALARLENELLVESIPRRGMFVKKITPKEIIDILQCRAVFEGLAARLVAEHAASEDIQKLHKIFEPFQYQHDIDQAFYEQADREFHSCIINLCENDVIQRMRLLNNIHVLHSQIGLVRSPEETLSEHLRIISAIENRDDQAAESAMRIHIEKAIDKLKH